MNTNEGSPKSTKFQKKQATRRGDPVSKVANEESSREKSASLMHFRFLVVALQLGKSLELTKTKEASQENRVSVFKARVARQ